MGKTGETNAMEVDEWKSALFANNLRSMAFIYIHRLFAQIVKKRW